MIFSGNANRVAATGQPATKAKIHLQWKANFTIFKDKQLKLETNRRVGIFSVYNYTQVMAFMLCFLQIIRRSGS